MVNILVSGTHLISPQFYMIITEEDNAGRERFNNYIFRCLVRDGLEMKSHRSHDRDSRKFGTYLFISLFQIAQVQAVRQRVRQLRVLAAQTNRYVPLGPPMHQTRVSKVCHSEFLFVMGNACFYVEIIRLLQQATYVLLLMKM